MRMLFSFKKKIIADCGHETKRKDRISSFGESAVMQLLIKKGKTPYCHRCIEKMSIRCAWCGRVIFISEPITLYIPLAKGFKIREYAVVYNKEPLQLVGCLRQGCAEMFADRSGFWLSPGKVKRVPNGIEILMEHSKEGKGGAVIIRDVNKP